MSGLLSWLVRLDFFPHFFFSFSHVCALHILIWYTEFHKHRYANAKELENLK